MPTRRGRTRVDQLLVERGLAPSRARAQALVLAGRVRVGGRPVDKPGTPVDPGALLDVAEGPRWVSRAGAKLEGALAALGVDAEGRLALDVGASTGGFTQVLLAAGARAVIALDVGAGQLDWGLRNDPRVVVVDGVNARYLEPDRLAFRPGLAVVDVSFISLRHVLPAVGRCLANGGEIVALVKPQFEIGRGRVGRGGIVRDPRDHEEVLARLADFAGEIGWGVEGIVPSPITGAEGNVEFFLHLRPGRPGLDRAAIAAAIRAALTAASGAP